MNYREEVLRTLAKQGNSKEMLTNAALGLAGESGEVADILKKHVFQGHDLDKDKLVKELGDIRWYMELAAVTLGTTMDEIERLNVEKLRKRYPEGFSTDASVNRPKE
jgi:NTP pyrophosphatase (non-canonical NTP hydrolase)